MGKCLTLEIIRIKHIFRIFDKNMSKLLYYIFANITAFHCKFFD